ncbi:hypothetical protein CC86DRAFT_451479 [Ophiobolus disseminans]|uniref:Uncharacterized protein n=1 Tax=Ophiobolus disseminans TaxID=1469910 RepID=A0A6A7AL06_9PLEO|nr:hypothetical protein CC86DRAFT_451479 [Ophiobolus disseminans]
MALINYETLKLNLVHHGSLEVPDDASAVSRFRELIEKHTIHHKFDDTDFSYVPDERVIDIVSSNNGTHVLRCDASFLRMAQSEQDSLITDITSHLVPKQAFAAAERFCAADLHSKRYDADLSSWTVPVVFDESDRIQDNVYNARVHWHRQKFEKVSRSTYDDTLTEDLAIKKITDPDEIESWTSFLNDTIYFLVDTEVRHTAFTFKNNYYTITDLADCDLQEFMRRNADGGGPSSSGPDVDWLMREVEGLACNLYMLLEIECSERAITTF